MRKFEINVPVQTLPDITKSVHSGGFAFSVVASDDDEIVKIEIPYEKDQNSEIEDAEDEINRIVEEYYEEQENS